MSKILLIEDKRSGYSMKRYVAHLKQISEFEFSVISISNSFSKLYTLIFKYIILPFKVLFAKEYSIIIPSENYAYLLWLWRGEKSVVVCHDLHDLMNKEVPFYLKCFIRITLSGLAKATNIVTVSEHTQIDLIKYQPKLSKNKIRVIHNSIEDFWFTPNDQTKVTDHFENCLPESYVLMVGTNAWYKNIGWGLKVIKELNMVLVKVGALSTQQIDFLDTYKISYTHLRNVKEAELKHLYLKASFLFFPSIHEGFGWPVLEAMATKCLVIASEKASIPEIAGEHVQYIDLKSIEKTLVMIRKYLESEDRIEEDIKHNFKRAQSFSFERFSSAFGKLLK